MVSKLLVQELDGTPPQITFADFAGDFSPTAANDLRHATAVDTEVQLTLVNLANGAARQSAKADLGENRAQAYFVRLSLEFAATPVAGERVDLYWGNSQHATAGTGNPGALTGSDAAYTGYSSNLAASLKHLDPIGSAIVTAQATTTVQVIDVGIFMPKERYGILVLVNEADAAIHSDDIECHVVLDPIVPEGQ